jgi:prolyl 4-hydroxylase
MRERQRIFTAILYLNDVSSGGETYFTHIDLKVEPKGGKAIIWRNVDENGKIDQSTFHEAKPVEKGEKWIATKWLREREFI